MAPAFTVEVLVNAIAEPAQALAAVKFTTGNGYTVIACATESVQPAADVATKLI